MYRRSGSDQRCIETAGDYGADIVVAEGQSLGTPMQYGGPYLGIMACREGLVRRMPGRLVGQTVDRRGRRCWVLTLQTREQHIRREKATSNICTNQGRGARATVYLSLLGPQGLRNCRNCVCKNPVRGRGGRLIACRWPTRGQCSENRPRSRRAQSGVVAQASAAGFFAGVPLGPWYPELADCFLVAVTEKRTKQEIDALAACLAGAETVPAKKGAGAEPARRIAITKA
jgi:glycine dehydrogenase subunit 1